MQLQSLSIDSAQLHGLDYQQSAIFHQQVALYDALLRYKVYLSFVCESVVQPAIHFSHSQSLHSEWSSLPNLENIFWLSLTFIAQTQRLIMQ